MTSFFNGLTPINFMTLRRFGRYKALVPPPPSLSGISLGRDTYTEDRKAADKLNREMADYQAELLAMPKDQFEVLYDQEKAKWTQEHVDRANAEEAARFFNLPTAMADFVYWAKSAHWTIEEGVTLLLGRDPRVVSAAVMEKVQNESAFARTYQDVRLLVERQFGRYPNPLYTHINPPQFIAWAERVHLTVPALLRQEIERHGNVIADWQDLYRKVVDQRDALRDELKLLRDENSLLRQQSEQSIPQDAKVETSGTQGPDDDMRTRDTLLRIVGAIVGLVTKSTGSLRAPYASEAKLIDAIVVQTGQPRGLSKRNLEAVFAEAKRVLPD